MSKFSLDVLQRCVLPFTKTEDSDVIPGAAFREEVALIVSRFARAFEFDPLKMISSGTPALAAQR